MKQFRGFAAMKDREQQRLIASRGGKEAHARGSAREWTPEEARAAGLKGVAARIANRQTQEGPR